MDTTKFDLAAIEAAEAQADQAMKRAEQVSNEVARIRGWLERATGSRAALELREQINEAQAVLATHRQDENVRVRRAAWVADLEFRLAPQEIFNHDQAKNLLAGLVENGLLVETEDGYLLAYDKTYAVSPDSLLGEEEIEQVKKLVDNLLFQVRRAIQSRAVLDPQDLVNGRTGTCFLYVPSERYMQDNREVWRPGGSLTVEVKEGKIFPVDVTGAIEGVIQQASQLGVRISCESLRGDRPPYLPWLDRDTGRKTQLLWYLVRRGINYAKWVNRAEELATITPEQFFLEGQEGTCLADFQEPWQVRDSEGNTEKWIPRPVFLIRRVGDTLEVVDTPDHLQGFLEKCLRKQYPDGERFDGIDQPLQAVLRAINTKLQTDSAKRQKLHAEK